MLHINFELRSQGKMHTDFFGRRKYQMHLLVRAFCQGKNKKKKVGIGTVDWQGFILGSDKDKDIST